MYTSPSHMLSSIAHTYTTSLHTHMSIGYTHHHYTCTPPTHTPACDRCHHHIHAHQHHMNPHGDLEWCCRLMRKVEWVLHTVLCTAGGNTQQLFRHHYGGDGKRKVTSPSWPSQNHHILLLCLCRAGFLGSVCVSVLPGLIPVPPFLLYKRNIPTLTFCFPIQGCSWVNVGHSRTARGQNDGVLGVRGGGRSTLELT